MLDVIPPDLMELWRSRSLYAVVALVLWVGVGLIVRRYLMALLRRVAERTQWTWDDVLVAALAKPFLIAIFASGIVIVGRILPLSPEVDRAFDIMLAAAMALSIVLFADSAVSSLFNRLGRAHPALIGARGLVLGAIRGIVIGIGVLIFLDSIGVSIKPILASLGIGSLAVALALQETLANLFAGFYLVADSAIEPGHFVRLQSGEEGQVLRVGWRSTWFQTPQNNIVVLPNAKLAGSILTNFDLPDARVLLPIEVAADARDPERVEAVAREVARQVQASVAGATRDHDPVLRYQGLNDAGLRLSIVLSAQTRAAGLDVQHEFLKRLMERFVREGIVVPSPHRVVDLRRDGVRDGVRPSEGARA